MNTPTPEVRASRDADALAMWARIDAAKAAR